MKYLQLFLFLLLSNILLAVNTNISGIVNSYAPVTAVGINSIEIGTVSPSHTFVCGDRIMLIQMKGAIINDSNTSDFGDIDDVGNAGNYEMATVSSVIGTTIIFSDNILKSYTISGLVQAVYVPHYEDATVTSTLRVQAWDGIIGGVLAIEVDGTLTMNAHITASRLGFRGGNFHPTSQITPNAETCGTFFNNGNVGYDYRYNNANKRYAVEKGESITTHNTYLWGRGRLASAGGGGGIESGGGGGGGNFGSGGNAGGGNPTSTTSFFCTMPNVFGIGGASLDIYYSSDKIFLGGGGGAGNNGNEYILTPTNNSANYFGSTNEIIAAPGKNGGGIAYIKANTLVGNGFQVFANGDFGYTGSSTGNFGGGGGGSGGNVIMNVNQYNTNISINARGRVGSSVRVVSGGTSSRRRGAGGGGGGGRIAFFNGSTPAGVSTFVSGGTGGLSYDQGGTPRSSHFGDDGDDGIVTFNYSEIGSNNDAVNLVSSTTSTSDVINSTRRVDFAENGFLASINSNGQDLGNVTVTSTLGSNGPFTSTGCSSNEFYLPRVVEISPTIQPASACDVSLYITGTELTDFIAFTNSQSTAYQACWGAVNSINDLMVTVIHSDGSKEALVPTLSYISCSDIHKLDVQVSQFSTFYLHSNKGVLAGNVLPVEWLSFEADYISKDEVELNWATGLEINNDGFFVERSYDGENFEEIAWVNGKGNYNSKTDYRFIDKIDIYSSYSNVYYRLNQMDYNGEQEYSEIKALKLKTYNFIGEIYPNPTFNSATIDVINNTNEDCNVSLYNALGKIVYANKAESTTKGLSKINIDLASLESGVYTCVIEINGEKTVRRLIKK